MTFAEFYKQNLDKTRLLSKIASFLIAVILLIEVFSNFNDLFFSEYKWSEAWLSLLKTITMQAIVGVIFAFRFVFLFFGKPKSVWTLQTVWFVGWISIPIYIWVVAGSPFGRGESHIMYQLSIYKSLPALIPYFYFLLSPIHQFLHLIIAFLHRK